MKYTLVVLSLSALMLASCKKDRTCTCSVNTIGIVKTHVVVESQGIDTTIIAPLNLTNELETELKEVTKRRAKNNCVSRDEDFEESNRNGIPGTFDITVTNSGTREYDCKLK